MVCIICKKLKKNIKWSFADCENLRDDGAGQHSGKAISLCYTELNTTESYHSVSPQLGDRCCFGLKQAKRVWSKQRLDWNNRETQSSRPADYWENYTPTINTQGYTEYTPPAAEG